MALSDPPRALGPAVTAPMVAAARAADALDVIRYVAADDPVTVSTDTALLVTACAALVHAIYHSGVAFVLSLPEPVIRAYAQACEAYRVGQLAQAKEPG
jgi:hypothetical protein